MATFASRNSPTWFQRAILIGLFGAILVSGLSCGKGKTVSDNSAGPAPKPLPSTVDILREELGLKDGEGKFDVVNGWIAVVDLEGTSPKTLKPLAKLPVPPEALPGQPVQLQVRLKGVKITDLSDLAGAKITHLQLENSPVTDISVVKTMKLNTLWLNDSKVTDLSPLKGMELESLDISGTAVKDLSPLAGMKTLQRLNIARSAATDLTPLGELQLQRLIFNPKTVAKGLDGIRNMLSLRLLHTYFPEDPSDFMSSEEFWKLYDTDKLPTKPDAKK